MAKAKGSYTVKSTKKKRTMTEAQRKAAAERLAKAREARGIDGSASIHEDLRNVDPDSPLHWKKVKMWIKEISDELKHSKAKRDSKDVKDRVWYTTYETYVGNLKKYLDTGVYLDSHYGRTREGKMYSRCIVMAYDEFGYPKRNVGTWYPDIQDVWTQEMQDQMKAIAKDDRTRKQLSYEEEVHEDS